MYGIINTAVEQLIVENYGNDTWLEIKKKAGVAEEQFVNMQPYDDKITYAMVGAAAEVLRLEAAEVLEKFGEYWILHTAKEGYGNLLDMGGNNLPDFLKNLNTLHFKVGSLMPNLVPPSFEVLELTSNSLLLVYTTKRIGLAPMVVGLIKGLGIRFNTPCNVLYLSDSSKEFSHHFKVSW